MPAAATRPLTEILETLDRAELLQLIHDHIDGLNRIGSPHLVPSERNVVKAKCQVASRRASAMRERAYAAIDDVVPLAKAMDAAWRAWEAATASGNLNAAARAMRRWSRARDSYQAASAAMRKLEGKADRLHRRSDRLWNEWEAMGREDPS